MILRPRPRRRMIVAFAFAHWLAAAALAILVAAGCDDLDRYGRAADDHHSLRVAVQPFEALSNSGDVRSLARRIPNEIVDALGDSQIEAVLAGEQAGKVHRDSRRLG